MLETFAAADCVSDLAAWRRRTFFATLLRYALAVPSELMSDTNARRVLTLVRVAVGVMFLFFAEYKIVGSEFVHGGFQKYVSPYVDQNQAVNWIQPTLKRYVLPHPFIWARVVAWSELLIGVSLVLGCWVRLSSVGGAVFMLALTVCTWYAPGHDAPAWRYIGSNLDHIPLLMLFLIFLAFGAGETWGLDRKSARPKLAKTAR